MGNKKYSIGVDFGTLSARAILVDVETGREAVTAVCKYRYGVMDEYLSDKMTKLEPDWALQHPQDYLDAIGIARMFLWRTKQLLLK